jgi:magnesium-transporting ATPase (P-type)
MKVEKNSSNIDSSLLMKEIKGTDIKVGDILQLDQGEVVPCDILLINTSDLQNNRFVCSVDSKFANGIIRREKKAALDATRPFGKLFSSYQQILNGLQRLTATVEYWPFKDNDEFRGTFKLKSDPKVEGLNDENIIRKGSVLHTGHITGIALYCGLTSLYYKRSFGNIRHKESSVSRKIYWYSLTAIVLNLVFSVISTMILMIKSNGVTIIQALDPHIRDGLKIFAFIVLYSPLLPLFAATITNISNAFFSIWLERKYKNFNPNFKDQYAYDKLMKKLNKENANMQNLTIDQSMPQTTEGQSEELQRAKNNNNQINMETRMASNALKIMNPYSVPNLGCVDSVFFDKTGTLTQTTFEVQSFNTLKKMYFSRADSFKIGGLTDVRGANLDGADNIESERSYEGYDSFMYSGKGSKHNLKEDEVQVYDFWSRKVLPNPFSNLETYDDLGQEDGEGDMENEKFLKSSKAVKMNEKGLPLEVEAKYERIYDEIEFMTDTKTSKDIKDFLQMLTICHNAKVVADE